MYSHIAIHVTSFPLKLKQTLIDGAKWHQDRDYGILLVLGAILGNIIDFDRVPTQ